MEPSSSQSPSDAPDPDPTGPTRRERMLHEFPRAHVTNLAGGAIGPVYITYSHTGQIVLAEAKLFRAPFKRMVIDSPDLLCMFKDPTQRADVEALGHPWPRFRLVPKEEMEFDVARLAQEEYVRSGNKLEHVVKGSSFASRMEITPSEPVLDRKRSHPSISAEVQGTRHSERTSSKKKRLSGDTFQTRLYSPSKFPASPSPGASATGMYTVATALDEEQAEDVKEQMTVVKEKIFDSLNPEDQAAYEWVLTTGLKRQGKEGPKFRSIVADRLRELIISQGERSGQLQALHNEYAGLQRKLERRWPYHLPLIDQLEP